MLNVPLCSSLVDDADASYLLFELHVELEQSEDGTHRSEEPVSKSIRNVCAGVPIEMSPAHSSSLSSVRGSGSTARGLISAPALKTCAPTFFWRLMRLARCLLH